MRSDPDALYRLLMAKANRRGTLLQMALGLSWSIAQVELEQGAISSGLCFSPLLVPRNLPWSGTLSGKELNQVVPWVNSWDSCEATVGMAVINAVINHDSPLLHQAQSIATIEAPHLAVFEHFKDDLAGGKVVIIGRYPGLDRYKSAFDFQCIEKRTGPNDLPDTAAEWLLPQADWVFITASSIANKTLPRLLALSRNAKVVLMGPSMPWMEEWGDFGVDYLAGVSIDDPCKLMQILLEAGGTRIFGEAVNYHLLPL